MAQKSCIITIAALLLLSYCSLYAAADKDYFVGAYYYPWYGNNNFHNSSGTPLGSTTLVYHLNPRMTPQLGWYNQTDPAVISQHYKWARYAGIDFFVTSYWGRGKTEDNIIQNYMFDNPDRGNIKLAIFLETKTAALSLSKITDETNYLCDNYFNRPGYFRIDDKPVIFIYVTRAMSDANLAAYINSIRGAARNKGAGEVYIVGDEVFGLASIKFKSSRVNMMDAITNYGVYGQLYSLGTSRPYVTTATLNAWKSENDSWRANAHSISKEFIPAVTPGFNDKGTRDVNANIPTSRKLNDNNGAFGSLFSGLLDGAKLSADRDMIMITSWNEWHEDTQIEPTISAPATNNDDSGTQYYTQGLYYEGYGMRYLNILRDKTTLLALCDYDNNYTVDFDDLALVLDYWLESCGTGNSCIEADLNSSGSVNFADFAICAQDWSGP